MRAGRLQKIITIQRYTTSKNSIGEVVEDWTDLFTARAEIKPLTGKEIFANNMIRAEMSHKITIRYQDGIKVTDRIVFNGRFFDITSIANYNEQNVVIEILTKEQI